MTFSEKSQLCFSDRRQQTDPSAFFGNGGVGSFDPNKFSGISQSGTSPGQSNGTFDPNAFSGVHQTGTSSGSSGGFNPNAMNPNVGQTGTSNTTGTFDPNKVNNMQFHFDPSSMSGAGKCI